MTLKLTILGCGTSGGVPRVGNHWGACDPANARNRRRRCSLLAERASAGGITTALVDTSPDLRQQLLDAAHDEHRVVTERTVDSHIKNVRRKLRDAQPSRAELIHSVYGVGYKFDEILSDA